jgi:predicted nucleotidyltransferase
MIGKEEILAFLKEHKHELFSTHQLVKLGLFGSFARNEHTEKSDIDLIIEFQPNTENISEKKYIGTKEKQHDYVLMKVM